MLQDDSPGFENTWAFVEKGLRELQMMSETKQSVCNYRMAIDVLTAELSDDRLNQLYRLRQKQQEYLQKL